MHEVLVISGKGGSGKTTVTASLASIANEEAGTTVLCDLDVDAPDLHLLANPVRERSVQFWSGHEAIIDRSECQQCGLCSTLCRFDAVTTTREGFEVDPLRCEGCKTCVVHCPADAIRFESKHCGDWYVSDSRYGRFVHAQLFPGEENSGRLVSLLKQQAREIGGSEGAEIILADGAPGIGCPVISSLSGTSLAVMVTEPTPSGMHDLKRVVELCKGFRVPWAVIINKQDLNPDLSTTIRDYCLRNGAPVLTEIPFDSGVVKAVVNGRAVTETSAYYKKLFGDVWREIRKLLNES